MEVIEAIHTRRSIRLYENKPVSDDLIEEILRAAMMAPSANNKQPWHFVIINDRKTLDKIPEFHPNSKMLKEAPLAILVCADSKAQDHPGYYAQDCSAATQNLLLATHAKGLGAVWLGIYPREQRMEPMKRLIKTPEHIIPFALISIGWPDQKTAPVDRFDKKRIHKNTW